MNEKFEQVPTKDGLMKTFIAHPDTAGPYPVIVLFMDIWGVREELKSIAKRIAAKGYYAVLPNLYYRQGDITNVFRNNDGRMISLHKLDKKLEAIVHEQRKNLSNSMIISDIADLILFIEKQRAAKYGPMGSVGWCMGGWIGFKTAVEFPDKFQATATLHATKPLSDQQDSPHLQLNKMRGGLYCGWAGDDHLSPPSLVAKLEALLASSPVDYRGNMHIGAEHGYALPDRDIYAEQASEQDWSHIFDLYQRYLCS